MRYNAVNRQRVLNFFQAADNNDGQLIRQPIPMKLHIWYNKQWSH
jgi:hypothetical protein